MLLLLNDSIEFLITDLALASHSIPSFTLSSLSVLAPVLDEHPPSAIVVQAEFLPQLLEQIHDWNEGAHHTIIVVGNANLDKKLGSMKFLRWEDIERQGAQVEQVVPAAPSKCHILQWVVMSQLIIIQNHKMCFPSRSSRPPMGNFAEPP